MLIASILKGEDDIGRAEFSVSIPISGRPDRVIHFVVLIETCHKHLDQVITREFTVVVGIAEISVMQFLDRDPQIFKFDDSIAVEIVKNVG